jgi:hypothetical protein
MISGVMLTLLGYRAAQTRTPGTSPTTTAGGPSPPTGSARPSPRSAPGTATGPGDGVPAPEHRLHHRLPGLPLLFEAPAHLPGPHQRGRLAAAGGPGAALHDARHGHGERLRGHRLRGRPHRGPELEAAARHPHLHRVRAVPGRLPGLEHGQAAVAQAPDHGAARQPLRVLGPPGLPSAARGQRIPRVPAPRCPRWCRGRSTPTCCGRV